MAPVIRRAALVQVLEHEKRMAKGAKMCIICGDRVGIGVCLVFVSARHCAQTGDTTLFFYPLEK
jgi:hypothetical protein